MSNLLALVLWNPFKTLRFGYTFAVQILLIVLRRILLPHYPHYQTLRLQLQRAYLASTNLHFPDLVHRLPVRRCPETRARKVTTSSWTGYFVPGSASAKEIALDCSAAPPTQRRNCVVLYAHGGGYARGEARMYLNYMERWIARGAEAGLDVAFLSVEYPLTTDAPHPAQRDAFLGAYRYLLDQGVPASRIVFMGDSAGGQSFPSVTNRPSSRVFNGLRPFHRWPRVALWGRGAPSRPSLPGRQRAGVAVDRHDAARVQRRQRAHRDRLRRDREQPGAGAHVDVARRETGRLAGGESSVLHARGHPRLESTADPRGRRRVPGRGLAGSGGPLSQSGRQTRAGRRVGTSSHLRHGREVDRPGDLSQDGRQDLGLDQRVRRVT